MAIGRFFGRAPVSTPGTRVVDGAGRARRPRPRLRRLAGSTALLVGLPLLTVSLTVGTAAASGAGKVTVYPGISDSGAITAGPDGALRFTGGNLIGRITTTVTPKVGGFTPRAAPIGAMVTISGQNLSDATRVAFSGLPAVIVSDTAAQIVAKVPSGASTGPISVTTHAGTATSTGIFIVT